MGEVPILTVSAQVFQIDQETKKSWLPMTQQSAPVSLYHDGSRNTYRIICIDDNKVIINCFIKSKMKFLKTSQKFGQWVDNQAATVYGIGCKSEAELSKFADKFEEVKQIMSSDSPSLRSASQERSIGSTSSLDQPFTDGKTVNGLSGKPLAKRPPPPAVPDAVVSYHGITNNHLTSAKTSSSDLKCSNSKCNGVITLLRAENDRLKLELAQSSSRAKEWEVELKSLRNSNVTLTTVLEESRMNAEEWQRQLKLYSEEIKEANSKLDGMDALVLQLNDSRARLKEAEQMSIVKEEELMKLRQQYNELKRMDLQNQKITAKLQDAENENIRLKNQVRELTSQVEELRLVRKPNQQGLKRLQEDISSKINELYAMNDMLAEELQNYLDT